MEWVTETRWVKCGHCKGLGMFNGRLNPVCRACNGTGSVERKVEIGIDRSHHNDDLAAELDAMTDKIRGIKAKPGEGNGYSFSKGATLKKRTGRG